ncbi:MAG: pitrilysin family protein [Alistipes sp.]
MKQPPITLPDHIETATAHREVLPNGTALYTLPADEFEVLRVSFVFRAGSSQQNVPFSASATANMLAEGSRDRTAQQIAEQLDYYGSYYDVSIDRDYVYLSFCMLSKFFVPTLAVAEQIVLHPLFAETELRTYCAKRRQELAIERTKVETQAREKFAQCLFGEQHPYGMSNDEKAYDTLTRNDIEALYRRLYVAENCFVVCSGRIGDAERAAVVALAEQLPRGARSQVSFPPVTTCHDAFVHHAGAVQSSLRIGRLLFPREHPDFLGMQVVATVLGGYFGSRLMRNLREEHGYTYGVVAAMVNFEREGYLAVATQVGTEVTQAALEQIYIEIERLRTEPISDEELSLVKNIMAGEMMRILDGPFGIADVAIENILCDTDNTVIAENIRRIRAVTPADVQRLAVQYLRRDDLVTVTAGA